MTKVTVLGKSPAYQDAGGACSGYLVETAKTSVLLDCGNGVFAKLRRYRDYCKIDAVVVTHLHADHFLDLVPYAYALSVAPRQQPVAVARWSGTDSPARPRLIVPPGAREAFRRIVGTWGNEGLIEDAFELQEYAPDSTVEIGDLRARFHEVPHFTTTFAVDFANSSGGRFTFGADCRPGEELIEIARDTDLLMVEATLPRPERDDDRGHMTPAEAGEHARRAGARRVVLTHVSDELDELWVRRQGAKAFGGPVTVAREGAVFHV